MSIEWYYSCMGEKIGPFTGSEMRQRALDGEISHDTLVTRTGTEDWVTADRVKGLLSPPSETETEKMEPDAEEVSNSNEAESQEFQQTLSPKEKEFVFKVILAGSVIVFFLFLIKKEKTYTPDRSVDYSSNSSYRKSLDERAADLESRIKTISPTDHESLRDLVSDVDDLEMEVRQATSKFNRRPDQLGYTLQQRREAARRTLIDQGYSYSEAEQTVNDMEKYDLLLDPPRR